MYNISLTLYFEVHGISHEYILKIPAKHVNLYNQKGKMKTKRKLI